MWPRSMCTASVWSHPWQWNGFLLSRHGHGDGQQHPMMREPTSSNEPSPGAGAGAGFDAIVLVEEQPTAINANVEMRYFMPSSPYLEIESTRSPPT